MRRRTLQLMIALAAATGAGAAAAQEPASDLAESVIACLDVGGDDERLACFDDAAAALKAAGSGAATASLDDQFARDDLFGAESLESTKHAKREKTRASKLEAGVAEINLGPLKNVTVVLDNGQVWRQLEGDDARVRPPKDPSDLTAIVSKGAFGNYWMEINEIGRRIRVKRIK